MTLEPRESGPIRGRSRAADVAIGSTSAGVAAQPLAVSASVAARMCGLHRNTWQRWVREELTPAPCRRIEREDGSLWKALYAVEDLREWVRMGMPDRATFERRRERR